MPLRMLTVSRRGFAALLLTTLAGCTAPPVAPPGSQAGSQAKTTSVTAAPAVRVALAPTGTLRVAVYPGSPTSMVRGPGADEMRGVTVDIGRELARRLGVPVQVVVFDRVAQVVDALVAGQADMTITNASPARAKLVDFTPPLVALELGYLVLAGSPVTTLAGVDQAGVRVGVSQGSSSQVALGQAFKLAQLVPAASLQAAGEALQARRMDAFATNKAILFERADGLPGARVLPGRWGLEQLALAVPQGREAGAAYLREFVEAVRAGGQVQQASARAGLRGTAAP